LIAISSLWWVVFLLHCWLSFLLQSAFHFLSCFIVISSPFSVSCSLRFDLQFHLALIVICSPLQLSFPPHFDSSVSSTSIVVFSFLSLSFSLHFDCYFLFFFTFVVISSSFWFSFPLSTWGWNSSIHWGVYGRVEMKRASLTLFELVWVKFDFVANWGKIVSFLVCLCFGWFERDR
jgi:hypothetical protein